ncbi:MAG: hypothetical protein QME79_04145 [Bacillota bacterium]|nr:hypothetical protein [Bacillota bacterium]
MRLQGWLPERWVAVDFDQCAARGVVARRWGAVWTVEGWAEERWAEEETGEPAASEGPSGADAGARAATLRRLLNWLPPGRARLVVVLPRRLFLERVLTVPPLSPRHLGALVTQELNAVLPWTDEERYDGFALLPGTALSEPLPDRPSDSAPRRLLAITAQREALAPWLKACQDAGLELASLAGVVPAGVALLNAFRTSKAKRREDSAEAPGPLAGRGFLVGARDEVDLVALAGGDWGFSRSFPRAEAEAEIDRSRQFVAPEGGPVELWVPAGASWASLPGFAVWEWRPAGVGGLPAEYWAAWGGLLAAGGRAALPLLLNGGRRAGERPLYEGRRVAALALAVGMALLGAGAAVYRLHEQRAAERASAALAGQAAEVTAWRTVAFPLAARLETIDSLAASLPAGTRLEGLRLEGDHLVEFRAVASRASAVLSALTGNRRLAEVALAGPVTRRADGSEAFALVGRLTPAAPPVQSTGAGDRTQALAALRALGWAGLPPDQALTRLLVQVERAAAGAEVRLETKSAQLLTSPPGRQRLAVDVSFSGGDRSLTAFLVALAGQNPLLSLEVLAAQRSAGESGAMIFRLQLVLDRPSSAGSPDTRPAAAPPAAPGALAEAAGLTVPRVEAYPRLWEGRLFGLGVTPVPEKAGNRRPAGAPAPPEPPRSSLVLLGLVYDPQGSPRALVRQAGGGATVVVKSGDTVGGERVVEIRRDGIVVEVKGARIRLPLP